ncbi:MAG: thiol:disulfide interchange protein DsbA/DsbL [Alteromonadaceae bacterium]|nr:thiol:disulfide interchange protein DsbA/DsbL [Alteromonadaceae bacterium]
MKKILSLLVVLIMPLMTFSSCAYESKFVEGEHYTKVSTKASTRPEVREYFSFYCPHCFRFEPFMATIKKQLPDGVSFELNHVDFSRSASVKIQRLLSKALVVAQQLNMEDKLTAAIFNYLQVEKAVITSEKDLRSIFVSNGVDGDKFDQLMKSFSVNSKAKSFKKNQDSLTATGGLTGVPNVIVNGKYLINNTALDSQNFEQDYKDLIKHLVSLD